MKKAKSFYSLITKRLGNIQIAITKITIVLGFLLVALLVMFLTGFLSFNQNTEDAIVNGNKLYATNNFDEALEVYKKGLSENPQNTILNYNAGQAAYNLKNFSQSIEYYTKSSDSADKYLNSGNSSFYLAENSQDTNGKLQQYQQALESYHQGILKFPQEVSLKYNYEFVKNKIDQLNKNNKNEQNQDKNKGNKEKDTQNQDEEKDNKEKDTQNQDKDKDNKDKDTQNQDKNKDNKDKDTQNQDKDKDNKEKDTQNQDEENQQNNKKDDQNQKDQQVQENKNSSKDDKNNTEVSQVLKMLEKQEETSLKNNQEVKNKGMEDKYDW